MSYQLYVISYFGAVPSATENVQAASTSRAATRSLADSDDIAEQAFDRSIIGAFPRALSV